jgi:hypothetical protein
MIVREWVIDYKDAVGNVTKSYTFEHEDDAHVCMVFDGFECEKYENGVYYHRKGEQTAYLYGRG